MYLLFLVFELNEISLFTQGGDLAVATSPTHHFRCRKSELAKKTQVVVSCATYQKSFVRSERSSLSTSERNASCSHHWIIIHVYFRLRQLDVGSHWNVLNHDLMMLNASGSKLSKGRYPTTLLACGLNSCSSLLIIRPRCLPKQVNSDWHVVSLKTYRGQNRFHPVQATNAVNIRPRIASSIFNQRATQPALFLWCDRKKR